jgi:hypothetical protein
MGIAALFDSFFGLAFLLLLTIGMGLSLQAEHCPLATL